jgi:pimeloyl-ACP methyl ester carboxylesterase
MSPTTAASQPQKRKTSINGTEVVYHDSGPTESGLRPIVLVHGTGGSTASHYAFVFPMLATQQRVISIDLTDTERENLELSDLEQQIVGVIEDAGLDGPVTLVGYSLGAVAALAVAAHRPELVGRLVTIAGWMRTGSQQQLRNELWQSLRSQNPDAARRLMVFTAFSSGTLDQFGLDDLAAMADAITLSEFQDRQMDLNRRIDISADVPTIRATTLVIGCRDDYMVPPQHSRSLFGAIPDARYTEIASGHAVIHERPAELVHLISEFNANPTRYPAGTVVPSLRP